VELREFLRAHAISDEIGGNGRYVRFERGETEFVSSFFDGFGDKCIRLAKTVAGQSGGFIIVRRGFERDVPPQLRPDEPVYTSNKRAWSYHPSDPTKEYVWVKTRKGQWAKIYALSSAQLPRHLAKHHPTGNPEYAHLEPPHAAKYVLPPGTHGKRLDVPIPERIVRADRVFFVIEGSLKTDAILSAGQAAFGVPSVTLWDAPELLDFVAAMGLRDKQVVIVPDADWVKNPMVIAQAMLCRERLRDHIHDVVVAAPPWADAVANDGGERRECKCAGASVDSYGYCSNCGGFLKGVDDFLVAGGVLDQLSVLEREHCGYALAWKAVEWYSPRADQLSRNVRALTAMSLHADENGQLIKSLSMFARILQCDRETARKAIVALYRSRTIAVEGGLNAGFQRKDPQTGSLHNYEWEERPRVTIAPPYRATHRAVPLGDLPVIVKRTKIRETRLVEPRAS